MSSEILKFSGSPFPGAIACLIKIILLPSWSEVKILSSAKTLFVKFNNPINRIVKNLNLIYKNSNSNLL